MLTYVSNHLAEVIAAITATILILQLHIAYRAFRADHERRKKQATVEFVSRLRDLSWPLEADLKKKYKESVINFDQISEDEQVTIGRFLSLVEQLSTGVNVGVFDYDVVSRMIGYHLTNMYDKLQPYIASSRIAKTKMYSHEYEVIRNKILRDRTPELLNGNIKHS